jgi:hypothetical protein
MQVVLLSLNESGAPLFFMEIVGSQRCQLFSFALLILPIRWASELSASLLCELAGYHGYETQWRLCHFS